jgi:hypothetical protein
MTKEESERRSEMGWGQDAYLVMFEKEESSLARVYCGK